MSPRTARACRSNPTLSLAASWWLPARVFAVNQAAFQVIHLRCVQSRSDSSPLSTMYLYRASNSSLVAAADLPLPQRMRVYAACHAALENIAAMSSIRSIDSSSGTLACRNTTSDGERVRGNAGAGERIYCSGCAQVMHFSMSIVS